MISRIDDLAHGVGCGTGGGNAGGGVDCAGFGGGKGEVVQVGC